MIQEQPQALRSYRELPAYFDSGYCLMFGTVQLIINMGKS